MYFKPQNHLENRSNGPLSISNYQCCFVKICVCVYSTLMASGSVRLYAVYTVLLRNMYTCLSTVLSDIDKA